MSPGTMNANTLDRNRDGAFSAGLAVSDGPAVQGVWDGVDSEQGSRVK